MSDNISYVDKLLDTYLTVSETTSESDAAHAVQKTTFKLHIGETIRHQAAAAVVDDCLDKLAIIRFIINEKPDPSWTKPYTYKPLQQRLAVGTGSEKEEFSLFEFTDFKKCTRDLWLIYTTLEMSLNELLDGAETQHVRIMLDIFKMEREDEARLVREHAANTKYLEELKVRLSRAKGRNRRIMNTKLNEVHKIKEKYEEVLAYSSIEWKYVDDWEGNRFYLTKFKNDNNESTLRDSIEKYRTNIAQEERVHNEVKHYLLTYSDEKTDATEYWMQKYDADTERIEQEILEAKDRKFKLETEHRDLQKEYNDRCKDIEQWLIDREKIREEEELLRIQTIAAIQIQAWWRGTMLRNQLGPYSKRRKRKGKKEKSKAAAKKKKGK